MPLLSTRGAASVLGFRTGGTPRAVLIASQASTGASSSFTALGAQVGDLAVLYGSEGGSAPTSGGGAWSTASGGSLVPYYRVLTAGDIAASGAVTSSAPWGLTIYRGPATLVYRTGASGSGADPQTLAGFAASALAAGLLTLSRHYIPSSGGTPGLPLTPTTWASRLTWGNNAGDADRRIADRLSPANAPYAGQSITWNAYFTSSPGEGDQLDVFELRVV